MRIFFFFLRERELLCAFYLLSEDVDKYHSLHPTLRRGTSLGLSIMLTALLL